MKQNLHYFFSILLTIILLSPPAAVWADGATVGDPNTDYFTITNVSASSAQIYLKKSSSTTIKVDTLTSRAETWGTMTVTTSTYLTIPAGGYAKFRVNTIWTHATNSYIFFGDKSGTRGNTWELSGDLMTLVSNTYVSSVPDYSFFYLFRGVTHLKSISNLKLSSTVTSLGKGALQQMFENCSYSNTTGVSGSTFDLSGITGVVGESALQGTFKNCSTLTSIASLPQAIEIKKNGCYQTFYCCKNCTISEPSLPASKIGVEGCYAMFGTCQKITTAPDITTTSLGVNACKQMFSGCIRLETAPTLTHDTITQGAYFNMFNGCTSLTSFGDINASVIGIGACDSMFYGCTGLEEFGEINATTIQKYGCSKMFSGCTGLTSTGEINIATVGNFGCQYMFNGCTGLTNTGEINIETIGDYGCQGMFKGCNNLTSIVNINTNDITSVGDYGCRYMFQNCTTITSFGDLFSTSTTIGNYGCYRMFDGCKGLRDCSSAHIKPLTIGNSAYACMFYQCCTNATNGMTKAPQIDATTVGTYAFDSCFCNCTTLVAPPSQIRPTTLPTGACRYMFYRCYNLETVPSLPDLCDVGASAMLRMFDNCTALTTSPVINFKSIGAKGCQYMFYECTGLTSIGNITIQDGIGANGCEYMFDGCSNVTSLGTFSAESIGNYGCRYMFLGCTKLANLPDIDVETVGVSGCAQMFKGCSKLRDCSSAHLKATSIDAWAYHQMFWLCSTSATNGITHAPQIDATTMGKGACDSMFLSCTTLVYPPDTLHPVSLPQKACYAMFAGKNALTKFPVIKATTLGTSSLGVFYRDGTTATEIEVRFTSWGSNTSNWVYNLANTGTFYCSSSLPTTRGGSNIPSNWTVKYYPIVTFSVATDRNGNPTGGTWLDDTYANITGDWYGDEPFPTAKHDSKNFRGWVDADNNTVTWESDAVARANPANTITLYADFTDSEYTLEWDFNGGATSTPEEDYTHGMIEAETPIVPPANPTRNGYVFNGWNTTPASTMPAENVTYTAQWTAINYTFDVATNGGTWDGSDEEDQVLTVSDIAGMATPQKTEFTFVGWNTETDGSGDYMDASVLPTTATKYYAIFAKVEYFRFIAGENGATIGTNRVNSAPIPSLSYSTDNGETWSTFTVGTTTVALAVGESVCFKGINAGGFNSGCTETTLYPEQPNGTYWYFTSTDSVSVAGNIMTLVQGNLPTNTIPANGCFAALLNNMPITSAADLALPTTTIVGCYQYMFYRSSIRIAPELPAETVANYAYRGMFSQCTKLKIAPEIPATTVGAGSMEAMFHNCSTLTQAPSELKAQQLYTNTYKSMFWECTQLEASPIIRATTMVNNSMGTMFRYCSTLANVSVRMKAWTYTDEDNNATLRWLNGVASTGTFTCPSALPGTKADSKIPSNWTINYIPELTFDVNTNGGTWEDESTTARVLEPETTWTIPTDVTAPANRTFVGWNTKADGTGDWLTVDNQPVISTTAVIRTYYAIYAMNLTFNVASVGATWDGSANENRTYTDVQFRRGEIPSPQRGEDEVRTAWVTAGGDTLKANSVLTPGTVYTPTFAEYLCITAQVDNVNVGISSIGGTIPFNLYYSTDGMNWTNANASTAFVTLNENQKVYLRGTNASGINNATNYPSNKYVKFNVTNNAIVSGNIMYLIHPTTPPTTIPNTHCFAKLFKHDSSNSTRYCKITDASRLKLPATTLTASCYEGLFHDCQYLIYAPKLPATELAANCYKQMFYNCLALRRMEVAFDDWNDDGSGNPAYTYQWMYGTTTNAEHNARFIGPAVLFEHDRTIGHIQLNWKGMDFVLLDDQADSYYTDLKDMEGLALQQVTFKGTFPAKRWITFNVPFDFYIPEDHPFADHVYQFLGADGNADEGFDIHFQGGVYELEAGMPYLYYGDEQQIDPVFAADGEDNLILTIDADALDASNSVCTGDPLVNTSNAEFRGTVKLTPLPGGDKRYIFISGNRLYYPHASGNWLYAFSGYFFVPSVSSVAPRVRMMVNGQETSVEIEEFGADSQAAEAGIKKYIQDGVMVIERNGVKYDAQGHKLN